jgi:hypothetical protein
MWDGTAIASSLGFAIPERADVRRHTVSITCRVPDRGVSVTIRGRAGFTVTTPPEVPTEPPTTRAPAPTDPTPVPLPPGPPGPPPASVPIGASPMWIILVGVGLVGLVGLLRHLARARPDRPGRAGSGIHVIPVTGPVSGPTLRSGSAGPGLDVRVVPRADRGDRAMRDR